MILRAISAGLPALLMLPLAALELDFDGSGHGSSFTLVTVTMSEGTPVPRETDVTPPSTTSVVSSAPSPPGPPPPTPVSPSEEAAAAMSEGRWDDAERALMRVLETQPGDLDARARLHQVRVERMHVAVRQANAQRAIELQSTLDQGKRTLPESLQLSSPEVALADVLGPAESGDAMVVDLRGSTSAVVDPLFFRTRSDGTPMRRFADFGAPGQPISRFAFADSRYDGALSVAWMPTMRELLTQPGDLHRQREALLTSLADLPVLPMTLLSVDHGRQLEASRVKVAAAYETYLADRNQRLAQAATASLNAGLQMIAGMEQEGWLKPGDDLVKTIDGDPLLKAEFENRCRVVRVYAEMYLDAAEDAAYREMARNVTAIMRQGTSP